MRIILIAVIIGCISSLTQAADEHRPKKKEKRNLEHTLSHHYSAPHSYRLERRISTGSQNPPLQPPPLYYPGPPRPYRKGRPYYLPVPPYAVQMEPLIHYSQRDPLYDTNNLSPDIDNGQNALTDNSYPLDRGGSGDTIYIPHKPFVKIVEKPVYIKEPEPIIEIIIKESNVTLPPPPTEPPLPPPKKKKEEVQVFYVKYRKNPNGYGKDAVIYDKPVPAISPAIPEEPEPEQEWKEPSPGYDSYANEVTEPPRPSTTLRTIIKPDSEVYHSPGNNVKVTFGKEGFDYSKRASKPEDYPGIPGVPEGRQLSSFSNVYFKRPGTNYHGSASEYRPEFRAPQPYRPFNSFPQSSNQYNSRSPNRDFNSRPPPPPFFPPTKHSSNTQPQSFPNFSHSISHPPPPQYQSQHKYSQPSPHSAPPSHFHSQPQFGDVLPPGQRKPVPYTPFDNIRPSQPVFSQPLPSSEPTHQTFNSPPHQPSPPQTKQHIQFRPETHINNQKRPSSRPSPSFAEVNNQFKVVDEPKVQQVQQQFSQYHGQQQNHQLNEQVRYQQQNNNIRTGEKIIPPGGELVQSLPKFEQHLIVDPETGKLTPTQTTHQQTFSVQNQQHAQSAPQLVKQAKSQNFQNVPQQYITHAAPQNVFINQHQNSYSQSSPRSYTPTSTPPTTTTTTTQVPETPSTTTKDPKILQAQLPDEVPDDLREQLLSSGILNNADISILDYDKVGDIPLSALPPDQLANFYGAGGAQQLAAAGSEPLPQVAALAAPKSVSYKDQEMEAEESEVSEVRADPDQQTELKVVKYDPESEKGKEVQEKYIKENSQQVDPVVLNDSSYNRYLPLKVNGTQFPIPDVTELKGKRISSVVVLAPISYDFNSNRKSRSVNSNNDIELIQSEPLKKLLDNPTSENYKLFLESEKKTVPAKQSIILLVTGPNGPTTEKEIFMYDIATKTVSKLSGELSSAFVEAAEANSDDEVPSDAASEQISSDSPSSPKN